MIPRRRLAGLFMLAFALAAPAARGGNLVVDFNDLGYPNGPYDPRASFPAGAAPGTGSYDNGWDLNGGFTSNGVFFSNSYDTTFHNWGGWAYSDVNDPTTTGPTPFTTDYDHQFAAITRTAPGGSGNYGISSGSGAAIDLPSGTSPVSFEIANTTYDYLSMTRGDGFAKPFTTGDFLELKIFGYSGANGTGAKVGEVDFFLADYTGLSSMPVNVWTTVDLAPLAGSRSLTFDYASSDVGTFGINTPESFAMDNLVLSTAAVPEPGALVLMAVGLAGLAVLSRTGCRSASRCRAGRR